MSAEAKAVKEGTHALTLQGHSHTFTCHSRFSGAYGCRFCIPSGHPVNKLVMKQLNAADRVPEEAVPIGDGQPVWCEQVLRSDEHKNDEDGCKCTPQWPGVNQQMSDDDDESEEVFVDTVITRPTAAPVFPNGDETVTDLNISNILNII